MSKSYTRRPFAVHPSAMLLILVLLGVTALFAALSGAYLYTRVDKAMGSIQIPLLFVFNTFVLLFSSISIQKCRSHFHTRNERLCYRWGVLTLLSAILFLILQGVGWYQLLARNIFPGSSGGHGFLYAISILHFLHVLAGVPFLLRILLPLLVSIRQGNAALFFLDEEHRRRLKHTAWYWHFIDVVWMYLIVFFLVNSLV